MLKQEAFLTICFYIIVRYNLNCVLPSLLLFIVGVNGGLFDGGRGFTVVPICTAVVYVPSVSGDASLWGYDGDIPVPDDGDIPFKIEKKAISYKIFRQAYISTYLSGIMQASAGKRTV